MCAMTRSTTQHVSTQRPVNVMWVRKLGPSNLLAPYFAPQASTLGLGFDRFPRLATGIRCSSIRWSRHTFRSSAELEPRQRWLTAVCAVSWANCGCLPAPQRLVCGAAVRLRYVTLRYVYIYTYFLHFYIFFTFFCICSCFAFFACLNFSFFHFFIYFFVLHFSHLENFLIFLLLFLLFSFWLIFPSFFSFFFFLFFNSFFCFKKNFWEWLSSSDKYHWPCSSGCRVRVYCRCTMRISAQATMQFSMRQHFPNDLDPRLQPRNKCTVLMEQREWLKATQHCADCCNLELQR